MEKQKNKSRRKTASKRSKAFVNGLLLAHAAVIMVNSALILWIIGQDPGIHVSYLLPVLSGVGMGFVQPTKGWILALLQVLLIWVGYRYFLTDTPPGDLLLFSVYGSMGLTLIGGLAGSLIRRNFSQ